MCILIIVNLLVLNIASFNGINLTSKSELIGLLQDQKYVGFVKFIVGFSHFMTFIVVSLIFVYLFYRKSMNDYFQLKYFNPIYLLFFSLTLFFLFPMMGYLAYLVEKIDIPEFLVQLDAEAMESILSLLKMNNSLDLVTNILLISILPGIGEELLFRGIIQKEINTYWKSPHFAIWLTALIFAAFHFQVVGFLPKMMIGAILGYAYYYSGSLILPMILHALNNGFATISFYMVGDQTIPKSMPEENIQFSFVVIFTLLSFAIMLLINRIFKYSNVVNHE